MAVKQRSAPAVSGAAANFWRFREIVARMLGHAWNDNRGVSESSNNEIAFENLKQIVLPHFCPLSAYWNILLLPRTIMKKYKWAEGNTSFYHNARRDQTLFIRQIKVYTSLYIEG